MLYTFQVDRGGVEALPPFAHRQGLAALHPQSARRWAGVKSPCLFPPGNSLLLVLCYKARGHLLAPYPPSLRSVRYRSNPFPLHRSREEKVKGCEARFHACPLTFSPHQRQTYPTLGQGDLSHSCDKSPYQFMQKTLSDTLRASRSVLNHSGVLFYPPQSPQNAYRRF